MKPCCSILASKYMYLLLNTVSQKHCKNGGVSERLLDVVSNVRKHLRRNDG